MIKKMSSIDTVLQHGQIKAENVPPCNPRHSLLNGASFSFHNLIFPLSPTSTGRDMAKAPRLGQYIPCRNRLIFPIFGHTFCLFSPNSYINPYLFFVYQSVSNSTRQYQ